MNHHIRRHFFAATVLQMLSRAHGTGQLVKMELKHDRAVGHVRSDPILSQTCASGHVHTFYGPMELHPNTTYADMIAADASLSTSTVSENQSLYWHPTIYTVDSNGNQYERVFTRATTYYRWDNSILPRTEEFPPGFRLIASTDDAGGLAYTECCDMTPSGSLDCSFEIGIKFPDRDCFFVDISMAMPTCWDGVGIGDDNDHKDHMAYTVDGGIWSDCPQGYDHRLPQVQLFVSIPNYSGATKQYQLSHGSSEFHWDFFNGWQVGKLQQVIDECGFDPTQNVGEINPNVRCTPRVGDERFLTEQFSQAWEAGMCDADIRSLILDEETDLVVGSLPMGSCTGNVIPKSWEKMRLSVLPSGGLCDGSDDDDDGESPCSDSVELFFATKPGEKGWTKMKTCDGWVTRKSTAWRCLNVERVKENCPYTCTNCCVDTPGSFNLLGNGESKTCAWAADNVEIRCKKPPTRQLCAETCGQC